MVLWMWALGWAWAAPMSASEAVALSVDRSVQVAEAAGRVQAAEGRTSAAGFLANDPTISASVALVGQQLSLSASQPVSLSGQGIAERKSAKAEVDAATWRHRRARLEVAAQVRLAWIAAVESRQRVVFAQTAMHLASQLSAAAERRLETGDGSLLDARIARVEEAEASATWMGAVAQEGDSLMALAAWTGVPLGDIELPDDPLAGAPVPGSGSSERSDIAGARSDLGSMRAALTRERAAVLPPVSLGAFYEQEGVDRRVGPSVSLTVPLWQRNADGRSQALAEVDVAAARLRALEVGAQAELLARRSVVAQLGTVAERDVDLQAEALAALAAIATGYEGGELDLLTAALLRSEVLQGQRAWLRGRRVVAEARIGLLLAAEDASLLGTAPPPDGAAKRGRSQ
jgi:outer membrane protein, heavy metal efflux system